MFIFAISALILLPSCQSWKNIVTKGYVEQSKVDTQIRELELKYKADTDAKVKEVQSKSEKIIDTQDRQLQIGANKLYGANEAFKYYQAPQRLDLIINNRVTEAQAAIGKTPTYDAIQEENRRLNEELDEKKTTLEQLRDANVKARVEAAKAVEETVSAKKELDQAKAEWLAMEQKFIGDSKGLQEKYKEVSEKLQVALKKQADNQAALERMKMKMVLWCGIGAVIALAGAIYSPVGKRGLAIIAGILGSAAAAIPFIEPWIIATIIFVILAAVLIIFLNRYRVAEKTTDNLVNHIEDFKQKLKTTHPELLDSVKQSLKEWNKDYTKDGKTVEDKSVEKFIEERLKEYGRL
jgi:type II secretory pathway pseudopilin PulG